jgi:hypothetical protein
MKTVAATDTPADNSSPNSWRTAMDKNIAALLRTDTRTIEVLMYGDSTRAPKAYTYVTDLDIAVGDKVVVDANGDLRLVEVAVVHDGVNIEPNSNVQYKWIISKVDTTRYDANMAKNKEIEQMVGKNYQQNLRRGFAEQILNGMDAKGRSAVTKLLGN